MALTITSVRGARGVQGTMREELFDIVFDTSYPTGGYAVTARTFGLGAALFGITPCGQGNSDGTTAITTAYVVSYDPNTGKLQVFRSAGATPAGTLSKPTFTVTKGAILASSELGLSADSATGTVNNNTIAATLTLTTNSPVGTPTFTGTAISAAALAEVANGVSLAALKVRVRVVAV